MPQIKKTLLIGLGGTGQEALAHVKKRMLEAFDGEIPPMIRFVCFDAAPKEGLADEVFHGEEFRQLRVTNVQGYVDEHAESLGTWLDLKRIPWENLHNIDIGAGQIRQVGRLALQFYMKDILRIIKTQMDAIWGYQAAEDQRMDHVATGQVIFFGSMAGGTGSGTLLDLASAVRRMAGDRWSLTAYLMMPGVFIGKPLTYYVEENSYAFLRELDFFMTERAAIVAGEQGDLFSVEMSEGISYRFDYPFNNIILIDNVNQAGITYTERSQLAEAVGNAIYATTGMPVGAVAAGHAANPDNMGHAWEGGRRCWYRAVGIAELRYPRAQYAKLGERMFISRLLDQMKLGEPPEDGSSISDPRQLADAFIVKERLQESGEKRNEIIDTILPPRPFQPQLPETISRDVEVEPVWQANRVAIAEWVAGANRLAGDNRESLLTRIEESLAGRVDELLCSQGGNIADGFVSSVRGYFTSIRTEMTKENADAANRVKQLDQAIVAMKAECAEKSRKVFGKREAVRTVLAKYRATLVELAVKQAEQARTFEAINLCSTVIVQLDEMSETLRSQQATLGNLIEKANDELTSAKNDLARSAPFEKLVGPSPEAIDIPAPSARDFYAWFRVMDQGHNTLAFWSKTADDAFEYLLQYASKEKDVAGVLREQSLASVMRSKNEIERDALLRNLDQTAQPLLDVEDGKVRGRTPQDSPSAIYIVAGSEEFFAVFDDPNVAGSSRTLKERLTNLNVNDVEELEIADDDRAYFYRRWGAVPAFALSAFKLLKSEYTEMASNPYSWSLHLDKRWDDVIPDLEPTTGIEEKLWVWALAVSDIPEFQRVKRAVNSYTFTYYDFLADGTKVETPMQLGQGLSVARTAFFSKRDWIAQSEEHVIAAVTRMGNAAARQQIDAYKQRLMSDMNGADEARKPLLREELEAIATFAAGLR